ncbi:MAG: potassium transporter TrkG [Christensenellales bacterium]
MEQPCDDGAAACGGKVLAGAFQSVTTRTAGFNSIDQGAMTNGGFLLTLILMFIGAAPGSTGGGIKVTTFFVLLLTTYSIAAGRRP